MLKRIGLVALAAVFLGGTLVSAQVQIEGEDEGGFDAGGEKTAAARMPLRAFERFSLETATATGFWAEVGAFYSEINGYPDEDPTVDADIDAEAVTAAARFAYGQKNWEAGLQIPYYWAEVEASVSSPTAGKFSIEEEEDGLGDLQVWGKFIPLRGPQLDLGGGVQLSLPTDVDDEDDGDGFGSGQVQILPFITGTVHLAILDIRGHVGLNILTEGDTDPDSLVYGFGVFLPIGDYVGLRGEFVNTRVRDNDHAVSSFVPGVDVRIPAGPLDILLRPTGLVGISERSPDWGVGGSIVVAQAPADEMPAAAPPPPPPAAVAAPAAEPSVKTKLILRGVQFDFDKSDIRADAKPVLDAAVETLSEHGSVSIVAEGHTDSMGTDEYNEKLSQRRAASVRGYLVSRGIAAARIKVEGHGESKPVATNDTEDGRAQNRRVELRVAAE